MTDKSQCSPRYRTWDIQKKTRKCLLTCNLGRHPPLAHNARLSRFTRCDTRAVRCATEDHGDETSAGRERAGVRLDSDLNG
jgi:hypothetical protein